MNTIIPLWLTDTERVAPCPCGHPPNNQTIIVEGQADMKRWFHEPCMDFLKYEMDEDELAALERWRKKHHEN